MLLWYFYSSFFFISFFSRLVFNKDFLFNMFTVTVVIGYDYVGY